MIKLATINILGQPNVILNLKEEYDKTGKTIPTASENLLRIFWKSIEIALIIQATT